MKLARLVTIVSIGLTLGTPAFAQNLNKREARQQHRIAEGIENGSLTPKETARLERQAEHQPQVPVSDAHGGRRQQRPDGGPQRSRWACVC